MNAYAGVGLLFDIVVVMMLALSMLATSARTLFVQSSTYYGGNSSVFRSLLVQRCDMLFGLPTLVLGFILQLFPWAFPEIDQSYWPVLLFLLLLIVCAWIVVRVRVVAGAKSRHKLMMSESEYSRD
jgi:hypothetical protein